MANDQLITSDEPDLFLEYLLRCALTAPGAATSPTAGRILARLLVVGAVEGGDELITPYLVPMPGVDATFEVRTYRPGDLVPTEVRDGLRAAAALKIALRSARDSDEGIEVVSRAPSGLERCVLVRDSTGDFEFRFASSETLIGDPAECVAARGSWDETLGSWRTWAPPDQADRGVSRPQSPRAAALQPETGADLDLGASAPGDTSDHTGGGTTTGWWMPLPQFEEPVMAPAGAEDPSAFAPVGWSDLNPSAGSAGSATFADPPPGPVEAPEEAPVEGSMGQAELPASERPGGPGPQWRGEADVHEQLGHGAADATANVVVEVDLGQVEQLIRRALDDERRESVEPLARRLSARIGESLDIPTTAALVEALSHIVPRPEDLAEAVAADVGALLSETILRRRPGDPGAGVEALHLMAGIEQLQVRLDGLQDQFQKSAVLLQTMGNHLEAGDRRTAFAERITMSVDQEMQRLASRIDEQVTSLTANAGSGSELADGVARLTRKLRQSVAQLDRALVRLDEVIEQAGDAQVKRLALARGDEPAAPPAQRRSLGQINPAARR